MSQKVLLMILDGWGIAENPKVSAIEAANTPFMREVYKKYPHAKLRTDGNFVGLPEGQMGNSEVGHMHIGAGRIVYQNLVRIKLAIKDGSLAENTKLQKAIAYAKNNNKNIHLMGLLSDGGVHSHIDHFEAFSNILHQNDCKNVFIHAFTDGRDTAPQKAMEYLERLESYMNQRTGKIATIVGRYYAMDRDRRWERIRKAYDAMVHGIGRQWVHWSGAIERSYDIGITDEFLHPIVIKDEQDKLLPRIAADDVVICLNFRTDRCREITQALSQRDFPSQEMKKLPLYYVTMTNYDDSFHDVEVLFDDIPMYNTLGEVLSKNQKKQIRVAETEKYPHVTFFFSGGEENPYEGEKRILCPSPKVATYDMQPEMSAFEIRDKIIPELEKQEADFICLNFANADMVGHTGVFEAAVKACEAVDSCTEAVAEAALRHGYEVLIIADHGNADRMQKSDGTPHTAHTTVPVPLVWLSPNLEAQEKKQIRDGSLPDIAPTILALMGIEAPVEMTGQNLIH
ncbi:MAG: 2,3-bisphosphoglycerate-independent phosphoglycerate mutase [Bernardetiaceae bacterium]|nr:2,3-bisphosphoglycerate-independent phosphoglycerate mutase [Bernardetiaceae bacterium]